MAPKRQILPLKESGTFGRIWFDPHDRKNCLNAGCQEIIPGGILKDGYSGRMGSKHPAFTKPHRSRIQSIAPIQE